MYSYVFVFFSPNALAKKIKKPKGIMKNRFNYGLAIVIFLFKNNQKPFSFNIICMMALYDACI